MVEPEVEIQDLDAPEDSLIDSSDGSVSSKQTEKVD